MEEPGTQGHARRPAPLVAVAATGLLVLFAVQAVGSLRQKSVTTDEITYIAAGYLHWRTGRFDFNTTNPPLMKLLAGLPLLPLGLELPRAPADPSLSAEIRDWQFAHAFLYQNTVDADRILLLARLPTVGLGMLLGAYLFVWARRLHGDRGALLALFLYSVCPNVLAHARLATLDFGFTAFAFIATYHFWDHLERPRWRTLLASGFALAAAFLCKTTAVLLVPVWVGFALWRAARNRNAGLWAALAWVRRIDAGRPRLRQGVSLATTLAGLAGIGLLGLNAGYGFERTLEPLPPQATPPALQGWLPGLPIPLPAPLLEVLSFQAQRTAGGNPIYFAGDTSREGWWYVMPVAFAIKTPIPMLLILGWTLIRFARGPRREAEWLALGAAATVFAFFCYLKQNSIGLRYVLPVYPLLYLLAGRLLRDGIKRPLAEKALLALLVIGSFVASVRIHPHYLAYFNELIGGPRQGYRYLADSYLDWGQDLKGLKNYLERHDIDRIRLAYFGSADARYYGIEYDYLPSVGLAPQRPEERWWFETQAGELPPFEATGGPIAISATLLAGVFYPGYYQALRELEPIDQVGYSILIYDPENASAAPPEVR